MNYNEKKTLKKELSKAMKQLRNELDAEWNKAHPEHASGTMEYPKLIMGGGQMVDNKAIVNCGYDYKTYGYERTKAKAGRVMSDAGINSILEKYNASASMSLKSYGDGYSGYIVTIRY